MIGRRAIFESAKRISPILLILLVAVMGGCDTGIDKAVDGSLFNSSAGELKISSAFFDSTINFGGLNPDSQNALAGVYGNSSAFAVFKFTKPTATVLNGLTRVRLQFYVANSWSDGAREFALYTVSADWMDSTRFTPAFLNDIGDPVAIWSDTSSVTTSMTFELSDATNDKVKAWGTYGAFLLKESTAGRTMVNVYSAYSASGPTIEFISLISGISDTTRTKSTMSNYMMEADLGDYASNKRKGLVSDGYAGGFVLHISLPDSFSRTNAVNGGKIVIPIERNGIPPDGSMNVEVLMLTKAFTDISTAATSNELRSDHLLKPEDTSIEIDLSQILTTWTIAPGSNFGILFKSTSTGTSPAQIVVAPPDSITISYTTIPEVR